MQNKSEITIIGSGAIGTALGNVLAVKNTNQVNILSIEQDVVESISTSRINSKYFPNILLNEKLNATNDTKALANADIILLCIPSVATVDYLLKYRDLINSDAVIVNLAKGFAKGNELIPARLSSEFTNHIVTMKGPSFARDIINNIPTSFTLASENQDALTEVAGIFEGTTIYFDYSDDVNGVEMLSILKNIYAIIIGVVDAHFNSPNFRFMAFTKAFAELRHIHAHFGGKEETLFNYCGIGDFGLTSLNDMSRNHTLGLLIGKGFYTNEISTKVVLEGRIAVDVIIEKVKHSGADPAQFPLLATLAMIFNESEDPKLLITKVLS